MLAAGAVLPSGGPANATDHSQPSYGRKIANNGRPAPTPAVIRDTGGHAYTWYFDNFPFANVIENFGDPRLNDLPVPADYDGDGRTDEAVVRLGSPDVWIVHRSLDGGYAFTMFGDDALHDMPVIGDFDGDGRNDPAVYRPGSPASSWFVALSRGGFVTQRWGDSSRPDIPVVADYDGDGRADVAVRRLGGQDDFDWFISGSRVGFLHYEFGHLGDLYVPGDYNGDGRADVAMVRPDTGLFAIDWYELFTSGGFTLVHSGATHDDLPVPGDWDTDGLSDHTTLNFDNPNATRWDITESELGGGISREWGIDTDFPLAYFELQFTNQPSLAGWWE